MTRLFDIVIDLMPDALRARVLERERVREWLFSLGWK